jgi:hypothetical protein
MIFNINLNIIKFFNYYFTKCIFELCMVIRHCLIIKHILGENFLRKT